jgi:AbrB family looped-hinge helix DNA binding protein
VFEGIKLYGSATVGSKGQIVIPAEARDELEFKEGDKVVILRGPRGGSVMVVKAEVVEEMLGSLQVRLETMSKTMKSYKNAS